MATKLEAETRVKELEHQVKQYDPRAVDAREKATADRVRQLEQEVDLAREANERLNVQLNAAEDRLEPATARAEAAERALSELRSALDALTKRDGLLSAELISSREEAKALRAEVDGLKASGAVTGDHGVVDGRAFPVLKRVTVKWANLEYLRRNVPEDATTLILDRVGE